MAPLKQLNPEPPSIIPLSYRHRGFIGVRQWLEGKIAEFALKGENINLWEKPDIKDWLYSCVDAQPAIIQLVSNLGWKFNPAYYFFKMGRNFDMVSEGLGFRLKRRTGFSIVQARKTNRTMSTAIQIKQLLQNLYFTTPWHTLLCEPSLASKFYLVEAPEDIHVSRDWDVKNRCIKAGSLCLARDSLRDDYGVIITNNAGIPAFRNGRVFKAAGHVTFNTGQNADWRIVT